MDNVTHLFSLPPNCYELTPACYNELVKKVGKEIALDLVWVEITPTYMKEGLRFGSTIFLMESHTKYDRHTNSTPTEAESIS